MADGGRKKMLGVDPGNWYNQFEEGVQTLREQSDDIFLLRALFNFTFLPNGCTVPSTDAQIG